MVLYATLRLYLGPHFKWGIYILVHYESDEAKEIARLKKELRDTQDALEILKKAIGILGK